MSTCQRCKQPCRSQATLDTSHYDLLASHLSPEITRGPYPSSQLARLPPSLQAAYGVSPARPASPLSRRSNAPTDSFVVLTESQVQPTPSTSQHEKNDSLSHHLEVSQKIYNLLSNHTDVDHPLCTDCAELLQEAMTKQLEQVKRERERYLTYEKDLGQVKDDPGEAERLQEEIEQLKLDEVEAKKEYDLAQSELNDLQAQMRELDAEEEQLEMEEDQFWTGHSAYILELQSVQAEDAALKARVEHAQRELEKLQKTNVYYDAFCIGHEGGLATINGLRLGRLPNVPVEWPEINAAWGHAMLLIHTIARKWDVTFETYRLCPMASYSRIERIADKYTMELYGSGDFAFGRYLQNRRFDLAMVALLDCMKQLMDVAVKREPGFRLPFSISKDKIGDVSIKLQFSSDETWTRALRHVLLTLKMLLAKV